MDRGRFKPAATLGLPLAVVVALALVFALAGALASRSANGSTTRGWRLAQTYDPGEVSDIVAPGSQDAWMADLTPDWTVVVHHWNGSRWHIVRAPRAMASVDRVVITASSADNAWTFTYSRPAAAAPYSVAWHWNGSDWRQTRLPAGSMVLAATADGSADAWAFGELDSGSGPVESYAVHYNGQQWRRVNLPVLASSVSSLAARNIWVVGQTDESLNASAPTWAMANWTGTSWHVVPLPRIQRAKGLAVSRPGILALSPDSIWVDFQLTQAGADEGAVFLHYNGLSWARVPVPHWAATWHSNMTPDGRGGFWIAISTLRSYSEMYDYRNGHWSGPGRLSKPGHYTVINATATRPGTTQAWAVGYRGDTTSNPNPRAVVYEYRT